MDLNTVLRDRGVGVGKKLKGDAQPGDVRAAKTFSNVDGNDKTGTLTVQEAGPTVVTPGTTNQVKAAGIYDGAVTVEGDTDLAAANIKEGVSIFGVLGTFTDTLIGPTAAQLLIGKEAWANGTKVTGTMPNRGAVTLTPGTAAVTIPEGYHSGLGTVETDADLLAANIKSGKNIFGVAGSVVEATGNAVAADVLATKTFSKAGSAGLTGTMTNRGAYNITPGATAKTIPSGYHSGAGTVATDVDLLATNIKSGKNIFGVAGSVVEAAGNAVAADVLATKTFSKAGSAGLTGTMTNRGAYNITPGAGAVAIPAGYHSGAGAVATDADLIAANIRSGKNVFGVAGNMLEGYDWENANYQVSALTTDAGNNVMVDITGSGYIYGVSMDNTTSAGAVIIDGVAHGVIGSSSFYRAFTFFKRFETSLNIQMDVNNSDYMWAYSLD